MKFNVILLIYDKKCILGNFMGFPDLVELIHQEPKKRLVLSALFCGGLGLFYLALFPVTEPLLYSNDVYY